MTDKEKMTDAQIFHAAVRHIMPTMASGAWRAFCALWAHQTTMDEKAPTRYTERGLYTNACVSVKDLVELLNHPSGAFRKSGHDDNPTYVLCEDTLAQWLEKQF